jgi:adenylate kinase family enzyme
LLPYYKEKGALKTVNGMASMPEVAEAIEKIVN